MSAIRDVAPRKGWPIEDLSGLFGSDRILMTRAQDLLYVPDLGLQIVDDHCVAEEGIVDGANLAIDVEQDFQGKAEKYRHGFEASGFDGEVCILSNQFSTNFHHWMADELIKVAILECCGFVGRYVVDSEPDFIFQSLRLLGIAEERVVTGLTEPCIFANVVLSTPVHADVADRFPGAYNELRKRITRNLPSPDLASGDARLWMERGTAARNGRASIVDADSVHAILERHGFRIVDMAAYPLHVQIAMARSAKVIAGPHGAAFVHSLFMPEESKIIECFSPNYINPSILSICRMLHHDYRMLVHQNAFGSYNYGSDLKVNCDHLQLVMDHL